MNTDSDPTEYRAQCEERGVTWPSLFQGSTGGEVTRAWGVDGYPTIYVLDREGVIRSTGARGEELERLVDDLVAE